jgi:hypothetical protein
VTETPLAQNGSAPAPPSGLPDPLHPRPDESELARRAQSAAELVATFSASRRLDSRFRLAVGDLARAVSGLEGMRACGFAPEIADDALPRLAQVLAQVERALERARPELEAELRERETPARPPARRPRPSRARVATAS